MRIQKFLSHAGFCSRRKAEELILKQTVTVNGHIAHMGQTIDPTTDVIKVDGKKIQNKQHETIVFMLNKPRGVVCSHNDPYLTENDKTVFDFIPGKYSDERFLFCGRLDKESQGLLILTNNGELANKISHPSSNITKIYHVTLQTPLNQEQYLQMTKGILDDGEILSAQKVFTLKNNKNDKQILEIHLQQGRKREIRRMIEFLGSRVHRLKRIQIGQLKLKNLPIGAIKLLSNDECDLIFK